VSLTNVMKKFGQEATDISISPEVMMFGPKLIKLRLMKKHRKFLSDVVEIRGIFEKMVVEREKYLQEHQDSVPEINLLNILLTNSKENKLSKAEMIDNYMGMFLAGQDTTGHLMSSCLYCFATNSEYLQRVRAEIKENVKDIKNPSYEEVNKLEFLTACVKETLRLYTPVSFNFYREAIADHNLDDVKVKKGTIVTSSFRGPARNAKYFPKPEEFYPERWLENQNFEPFAYLPFWSGTRNCLGQHLAMLETKMVLIQILGQFEFELTEKDYKLVMVQHLMYEPMRTVRMKFKRRKDM